MPTATFDSGEKENFLIIAALFLEKYCNLLMVRLPGILAVFFWRRFAAMKIPEMSMRKVNNSPTFVLRRISNL